jgi:hypothetical protein
MGDAELPSDARAAVTSAAAITDSLCRPCPLVGEGSLRCLPKDSIMAIREVFARKISVRTPAKGCVPIQIWPQRTAAVT